VKIAPPRGWWLDAALLAGFVALTVALANGWFLGLDVAVRDWCDDHRPAAAYRLARGLNFLGNGGPVAGIAGVFSLFVAWRLRSLRPMLLVIAAFLLTTGVTLPLKNWLDRPAPHSPLPHAVELFRGGESYPAGHLVVAVVWYGVLVLLLAAVVPLSPAVSRAIRIVPVAVVMCTTTYLGFHWLTDDLAGLLLGVLLYRLLTRLVAAGRGRPPVSRAAAQNV
jgi:membrane-associated phospholipid phosphatase